VLALLLASASERCLAVDVAIVGIISARLVGRHGIA